MILDVKYLQTLLALDEKRSFVKAAEELCITQSALSHQIKKLEDYYQIDFLNRHNRPFTLTYAGSVLLKLAQHIIPEFYKTDNLLKNINNDKAGRLHIAIECHSCFDWLMPTMNEYRKVQPDIDMDISLSLQFEPLSALYNGTADIVITSAKHNDDLLHFSAIFDYELMLACAVDNPLTNKKYITPYDLTTQTLITYPVAENKLDIFKRFLHPASLVPREHKTCELTQMILQKVASNIGVCALPRWVGYNIIDKRQIKFIPLSKKGLKNRLYVCSFKKIKNLQYVKDFVRISRLICQNDLSYE
jgi:LysR family transcriptional regulator, regulator for metE and metH